MTESGEDYILYLINSLVLLFRICSYKYWLVSPIKMQGLTALLCVVILYFMTFHYNSKRLQQLWELRTAVFRLIVNIRLRYFGLSLAVDETSEDPND